MTACTQTIHSQPYGFISLWNNLTVNTKHLHLFYLSSDNWVESKRCQFRRKSRCYFLHRCTPLWHCYWLVLYPETKFSFRSQVLNGMGLYANWLPLNMKWWGFHQWVWWGCEVAASLLGRGSGMALCGTAGSQHFSLYLPSVHSAKWQQVKRSQIIIEHYC